MSFIAFHGAPLKEHNTSDCKYELGSIVFDGDHAYRYVKATAAITAGDVVVANTAHTTVANITGFDNTGDRGEGRYPYVEDTGLSETVGAYAGSYCFIGGGTGVGQIKRIRSNTATRFYLEAVHKGFGINNEDDVFGTDPDTTSDLAIISPWKVKKCGASDKIQTPMGYAPFAFTSGYYGWICVSGIGNPSMGGTGVIDTLVVPGDDTAGQGTIAGTGDDLGDGTPFGVCVEAGGDDEKWAVLLRGIGL